MENRILLDANAIIRFLLDDIHAQHLEVKRIIKSRNCCLVLPVVQEATYVLNEYYGIPRDLIKKIFERFKEAMIIEDEDVYSKAFEYYVESPKLDFVDCLLCAYHTTRNLDILTFDKKMKNKIERTTKLS